MDEHLRLRLPQHDHRRAAHRSRGAAAAGARPWTRSASRVAEVVVAFRRPRHRHALRFRHATPTRQASSRRSPTSARPSSSGRRCASGCARPRVGLVGVRPHLLLAHGERPGSLRDGGHPTGSRSCYLQGYLATTVVTTLFAAALLAEREAAAQTTEAWRRRHKAAIEASGNLLYELDPATGRILWDGDTRAVLGVAAGGDRHHASSGWRACIPTTVRAARRPQAASSAGEVPHVSAEHRMKRGEGEWITVGVNGYAIDDPTRRKAGRRRIIGFVKDISERVRAEAERQALAAQLKQAEKMEAVGRLAGGIAHDFNNILGAILGYGELAQARAEADPQLKRYVDTMVGAGNRAKALVVADPRLQPRRQRHPGAGGAGRGRWRRSASSCKGSKPAGVEVRLTLPPEDAMVTGDPTRLHQLAMNLASNAVQAMPGGGVLDIALDAAHARRPDPHAPGGGGAGRLRRAARSKRLRRGHPAEVIDRIFEPFFTTKPAGRGTGLGLALVHSVTRDHGGAIDVASEIGRGTTFTIWLPRLQGADAARRRKQAAGSTGRGQVILAVDDEPEVLAALEEMLANQGYEPAGYTDSRAALEAFRADPRRYEAVISDERMPGLTGTQLAVELRSLKPDIPIVIATGYGGEGFEDARAVGGREPRPAQALPHAGRRPRRCAPSSRRPDQPRAPSRPPDPAGREAPSLHDLQMVEPGAQVAVLRVLALELDLQAQVVHGVGVAQRVLVADEVGLEEVEERLVVGLHAQLARARHEALHLVHLALEDQVRHERGVEHDLDGGHAALLALLRDQALRDDGLQVQRQVHQQLRAALLGEEVDDAVQRLVGGVRVQRGHAQVARFREGDAVLHGLALARSRR